MATTKQPTKPGEDTTLDALYSELGLIEQREIDAIEFGRRDLLPEIRKLMLPLKKRINEIEGIEIYPEAAQA